jgi:hypothetical protein
MFVGHVGDYGDIVVYAEDATLVEGMGGSFENSDIRACLDHVIEVALDIEGFRGGDVKACVVGAARYLSTDGGDKACAAARSDQD